jgi:FKBP-type peptidyl-prolyl cis-trans isomerase (trigger factor)
MSYKISIKKFPETSEVEITGEIAADVFESHRAHVLKELSSEIEVDGFRKGHVPQSVAEGKIPEMVLLEEMAQHAINDAYPQMLTEEKIDAIGRPTVELKKLAPNNPLGFTIRTAVMPEIALPDYKKIAKEKGEKVEAIVEDKEVEETIENILKSRAPRIPHEHTQGDDHTDHEDKIGPLPELNDEFVKSLGDFTDVADFKTKLRANIELEKENLAHEKNRITIIEAILAETKISVPQILIDQEIDRMVYRVKSDITSMGLSFDDYLKHMGKKEEEIRTEMIPDAKKRVQVELIISEIAHKENVVPDEAKRDEQVAELLKMYKEADVDRTRMYVENMLVNEQTLALLESFKDSK